MLCESKGNVLESSFELTYQTKKQLTLIGFALRRFAAGIDYMIIMPTLWFYLKSFNSHYYFLGLVIAADSLVCFFLSPLVEMIVERTQKVRVLGFLANLLQIAGSMIYALPLYFYMPLVGRLVSGVGASFGSALNGEIKRVTSPEERNRVMIIIEGVRLFGIIIGPGMNFFLKNFDLSFGPWLIDERTAPGFFMAIVWLLVQLVHIFTVYDLHDDAPQPYKELPSDDERSFDDEQPKGHHPPIDEMADHEAKASRGESEATSDDETDQHSEKLETYDDDDDNRNMVEETKSPRKNDAVRVPPIYSEDIPTVSGKQSIRDLLARHDVIIILIAQFIMFFNQTAFETLVLLIGVEKLGFTTNILSIVFIVAGVEMVAVIVVVWSANKSVDAKYLLLTCLSAGILASFARLATTFAQSHSAGILAMTLLMGFFTIIGTPLASIAGKSLLPKITRVETHGFYQAAFSTAQHLGLVTGTLVASVLYDYLVIFSSSMIVVFIVVYMVTLSVVDKLNIPAQGCGK